MKFKKDQVAVITGAGSGIGRALALNLAKRGSHLALCDVNKDGLACTVKLAEKEGVKVTSEVVDVAKRDQVFAFADATLQAHGKVNIVFNNAGVTHIEQFANMEIEDFEWLMGINFWGVVYGCKAFIPILRKNPREACLVNISSIFGIAGFPRQSSYCASKFAVKGFTESLHQELREEGIDVVSVHPGGIQTNIARTARGPAGTIRLSNQEKAALKTTKDEVTLDEIIADAESHFITTPAAAAAAIVKGVEAGTRRVLVGVDAKALDLIVRVFPIHWVTIVQNLLGHPLKVLAFLLAIFAAVVAVVSACWFR